MESQSGPPRIKTRIGNQRACNQKAANGMLCVGRLRRWRDYGPEVGVQISTATEVYKCEFCQTIYVSQNSDTKSPSTS